ncbi:beta/gamma crystallin domain-containing protein [Peribacillus sp. NJ4]|uniref:beta/gamma crystallin domain-containing protein n=1 Tax=Peribacillus sp. NJ4 TaxID=3055862 RepID=UPI0025A1B307|nr:beta/gamma crystallin domain-containing protein [Peribacillus sp. NJ4]MDM5210471.1 beta/gamma crystallin domain-containing protein [Peribacillus sp. NJ4]
MYYHPYNYSYLDERVLVNTFYVHANGGGASFTLNTGDSMAFVGDLWNDQISSLRVAPKTQVILYEHINFGGRKKILTNRSNDYYLFNVHRDYGDNTSSIKTYQLA